MTTILSTAASRGPGPATVERLAREGWQLILCSRSCARAALRRTLPRAEVEPWKPDPGAYAPVRVEASGRKRP